MRTKQIFLKMINPKRGRKYIYKNIEACYIGEWAYHQDYSEQTFNVTHIPSGLAAAKKLNDCKAEIIAKFLQQKMRIHWDGKGEVPNNFKLNVHLLVKRSLREK